MRTKISLLLASAFALLMLGCQKTPEPKTTQMGQTSAGDSVALPAERLPPSDAAMPPVAAGSTESGNANTPTQANPATLTPSQEKSGMPHSGQVNNHSIPGTTTSGN